MTLPKIADNKKSILWFLIEIAVFLLILTSVWGYFNNKLDDSEQNLKAAKGYITQVELKNGELLSARDSYIASINDLEELLDITKQEVKDIQRQLDSKVAYISRLESQTRIEYIEVVKDSIIYVNNGNTRDIIAPFHYRDEWISFNGKNEFNFEPEFDYTTSISNININTPLTVGLTNDYQIFVTSSNPYVSFTNIEGAVIDKSVLKPRKKRFSWGLQMGVGAMYDILDKNISVGPYAGVGAEFNF